MDINKLVKTTLVLLREDILGQVRLQPQLVLTDWQVEKKMPEKGQTYEHHWKKVESALKARGLEVELVAEPDDRGQRRQSNLVFPQQEWPEWLLEGEFESEPPTFTELVNCTPHVLNIYDESGENLIVEVQPSGTVARCAVQTVKVGEAAGVPTFDTKFGEVQDLPEPESGKLYVVSLLVRSALSDRHDLASPGELIRDVEGKPVGCKGLNVNN